MVMCRIDKYSLYKVEDWEKVLEYIEGLERKYKVRGRNSTRKVLVKLKKKERKYLYDNFGIYWDCTF
jgi:hypothetical protein